jgi:calcium-independent phospholipase A2-gamma
MLYPNVPVELVVSIGTGYTTSQSSAQSMGWGALVNQLVASSTDTEDVHELLRDFLPPDKYFRFNPVLPDFLRIDEKNKTLLSGLKSLAKKTVDEIEAGPGASNFAQLIRTLRGPK